MSNKVKKKLLITKTGIFFLVIALSSLLLYMPPCRLAQAGRGVEINPPKAEYDTPPKKAGGALGRQRRDGLRPQHLQSSTAGNKNLTQISRINADSKRENYSGISVISVKDDWLDELIEKIWLVESSGRLNPPDGDGGRAAGPLQLHKCAVDDVNMFYDTKFTYADRYDFEKAKLIAKLYISWLMDYQKEEIACRIFNGGPRGWRKQSTDEYWMRIQNTEYRMQNTGYRKLLIEIGDQVRRER